MKVCIVSIHIESPKQELWKLCQADFISAYTIDYQYSVIANGSVCKFTNEIHRNPNKSSHLQNLQIAIDVFKQSRADYYLLLDSDAWPVRGDWQEIAVRLLKDKLYLAPARVENYDLFPHPCAFLMRKQFLEHADFSFSKLINLFGVETSDVGMAMPTMLSGKHIWVPLLKSNRVVPHPLYSAIYADLFYHHCAGSRAGGFRSAAYGVYDHFVGKDGHKKIYKELTEKLENNPRLFIDILRGV